VVTVSGGSITEAESVELVADLEFTIPVSFKNT